mmetsp:Transcript_68165/g.121510  ORF Transcript_68165/g.121510 Transcript_68165/m.121510 type:complete len:339 (-) Transcript_68165:56-1072(-)
MNVAQQIEQLREFSRTAAATTAHLKSVMAAQQSKMQGHVQASSQQTPLDPDIADLVDNFHISDDLARRLNKVMEGRAETFENDVLTLWDVLERADNPNEALSEKVDDLAKGNFRARSKQHDDMVRLCEKYKLDETASKCLIDAMYVREREPNSNVRRDLEQLAVHLEHSFAPSKLISMKLKEIRGGCNIGAVWHCCGDRKRKAPERTRSPPMDGGIGIEGVRDCRPRRQSTMYKSYTDHDLEQRDHEIDKRMGGGRSEKAQGLMTEEQALRFQKSMRREREVSRSRSRSRSRYARPRRTDRGSGQYREQRECHRDSLRDARRGSRSWSRGPRRGHRRR